MKVLVNFPNEFLTETEKEGIPSYKGLDKEVELNEDFLISMSKASGKHNRVFKTPAKRALTGKKLSHSDFRLLDRHYKHLNYMRA